MASSSSVVGFVLLPMPQGEGGTQARRAFPLRRGPAPHDHAAPRGGLHFGANPFSGGASERRAFAALLLLPKYRRFLADRMPRAAQIVLRNGRQQGIRRRWEEHTSEFKSLMGSPIHVFCLKKKKTNRRNST